MKFADFAAWSEVRFTAMIKTALTGGNDNFKGTYAVKIGLTVNGLHVEAHYPDDEIENVHKPLLRQLAKRHFASASRRTIVFQRAARDGKSTLTAFWEFLSRQMEGCRRSRRCRWMDFITTTSGWKRITCARTKAPRKPLMSTGWRNICGR